MKKKILALVLALTMCFGTTMTANAAVNIHNKMGATDTHNILDKNSSQIPKGTLQYLASKFKIEYTKQDLDALKKIFDADLYAKAYPDVAAAYGNDREALWNHYVTHGIKEGRTQISTFNVFAYIAAYPDLRNAFGDDLMAYYVHYANYGMNENRKLITVDAVTKAGYTITGINGQVIAVPKLEPAPSTVDSATEPDPAPAEEPASAQTPAPSQNPSPSVTPTPTPEEPSEPTTCNHSYTVFEPIESKAHLHYAKCEHCGEYEKGTDGSKLPIECSYIDFACKDCERACNHDGWNSSTGTCIYCGIECSHYWKESVCVTCGKQCEHKWNTSGRCETCNKSCEHEYEISQITDDAQYHQLICKVCGHTEKVAHNFSEVDGVKKCEDCSYTPSEEIPPENEPDIS